MSKVRTAITALVTAATIAGAAAPAAAGGRRGWGGYRHHHHHHGGGGTAGAILGGLLIGGAIAAVASAADDADARSYPAEPAYEPAPPPVLPRPSARTGQGAAVDLCTAAAEDDGQPSAQVNTVTQIEREGAGWHVTGVVDTGRLGPDGYRVLDGFSCRVAHDEVVDLRYDATDNLARR
jgi:hypothetical protein